MQSFNFGFKPVKMKPMGFGMSAQKKKRKTLTPAQKNFVWEHPSIYGRTCHICHKRITKPSDLELDHRRAYSKGGTKLALAHKDCNRMKSSGSLSKIQKTLGLKTNKKIVKKRQVKKKPSNPWGKPIFKLGY